MADSALPALQDLQEWHDPLSRRPSASKSSAILLLLARRQSGEALSWSVWTDGKAARRSPASSGLTAERRGALRLRLECGLSGERARRALQSRRLNLQPLNFFLQIVQEPRGVRPVHLRMVELERNGQRLFPQMPFVFAPNQKRVVEHAAVHADCPIYLIPGEG